MLMKLTPEVLKTVILKRRMSHGGGVVRKMTKKCHVLFECTQIESSWERLFQSACLKQRVTTCHNVSQQAFKQV